MRKRQKVFNLIGVFCLVWVSFLINSCSKQDYTIGNNLVDVKSNVFVNDTFTLATYTVKADSVKTSGYNVLLVGSYDDVALGKTICSGYFRIIPSITGNSLPELSASATFDSMLMVMKPTGYYYGDTTTDFGFEVRRLTQNLYNDNYDASSQKRYNTNSVGVGELLASVRVRPRPLRRQALSFRLSDELGVDLFNKIKGQDDVFDNADKFVEYFKGMAVVPDNSVSNTSIIQFSATDTALYTDIYYHDANVHYTFRLKFAQSHINQEGVTISDYLLQYNQIKCDYTSPLLGNLNNTSDNQADKLSSRLTGDASFCQAGNGLYTRIEMPTLKNVLLAPGYFKLLRAELILKPIRNSYKNVELPKTPGLYYTDDDNDFLQLFANNANVNVQLTPYLNIDDIYSDNTSYTYDVTSQIYNLLYYQTNDVPAILLSVTANDYNSTLKRMIIGNSNHPTNASKLKLTYWRQPQ